MTEEAQRREPEGAADDAAAGEAQRGSDETTTGAADAAAEAERERARADENWDKYLRAMAELENVRKRASRDVEKARRFALEPFAKELLDVRDSLEMGLAAAADSGAGAVTEGVEATLKQLSGTMERFGIVEVNPEGEPFDPQQHEAMTMQPSPDAEPGTVLTVFQKGYSLNGRLLRPARVVVAEAPAGTGSGD